MWSSPSVMSGRYGPDACRTRFCPAPLADEARRPSGMTLLRYLAAFLAAALSSAACAAFFAAPVFGVVVVEDGFFGELVGLGEEVDDGGLDGLVVVGFGDVVDGLGDGFGDGGFVVGFFVDVGDGFLLVGFFVGVVVFGVDFFVGDGRVGAAVDGAGATVVGAIVGGMVVGACVGTVDVGADGGTVTVVVGCNLSRPSVDGVDMEERLDVVDFDELDDDVEVLLDELLVLCADDGATDGLLAASRPSNLLAKRVEPTKAPAPNTAAVSTPIKARLRERSATRSCSSSHSSVPSYQSGSSSIDPTVRAISCGKK